ncbi:MFS transporter [Roseimaritima ulvae]|uniref:Major Facilitator Superfamily protein n=1 Tax=Roseimaritima ulvae TaxID=980254 RepID=A0A5B9QJR7_9BACT|nr:MFS transporter [Roseimaritima ulvae]QEG39174.1 Major Facilitator Superfamily protein [Roseimaritima ulvae]
MDRILTAQELATDMPPRAEDQNLVRSLGDAAFFGGMVGCGETYFSAFALAVGLGETAAGLVASVPLVAGGTLQLISPWAIRWLGSLRRWIVTGAVLQAAAFIPLAVAAWYGALSLTLLLLIASLYWAAGLATGPAWNTWIEQVVPAGQRARFFSRRSRLQQFTTFAALLAAGGMLQWSSQRGFALLGFAALFCAAGSLRLVSAWFLHRTNAPPLAPTNMLVAPLLPDASGAQTPPTSAKRLLAYLVLMQVFVQFSGPFFVPYMLERLDFSYGTFVAMISLAFVSKVFSMTFWGRVAEQRGAGKVLWLGGIGLVPLSALWIVSTNVVWLAVIQIVSGVAWAAYELGFFLMFFETLPAGQRTRLLTYYNFANTLAMAAGAMAGAGLLYVFGCHSESYYWLFGVSSAGRLLCLGVLSGIALPTHSLRAIRMRILAVRPGASSVVSPVTASAEEPADAPS